MTAQKLMVFWKYDSFPYFLYGELEQVFNDGWVAVKGYSGMRFKPVYILPWDAGLILSVGLDRLKADYNYSIQNVHDRLKEELRMLLKETGL